MDMSQGEGFVPFGKWKAMHILIVHKVYTIGKGDKSCPE